MKVRIAFLICSIQWCLGSAPVLAEPASASAPEAGPAEPAAQAAVAPPALSAREKLTLDFANGLYARKMYDPALDEYRKFIRANPASAEIASARFRAADCLYFMKKYRAAAGHFEKFLKEFPGDKRVRLASFRIGTAHFYREDYGPALRIFERLEKEAEDPNLRSAALFYRAEICRRKKDDEGAFRLLNELLKAYPQTEYASYAGVIIGDHYLKKSQYEDAVKAYQSVAERQNPRELSFEARFKIAELYFIKKDYETSRGYYGKLFEKRPAGEVVSEAERRRERALREKALIGLFYCDYHLGDLAAAAGRLESEKEFIATGTAAAEIHYLVACLLADQRKYDEALAYLDLILQKDGGDELIREKAVFKKAAVYLAQGQKESSLKELEKLFAKATANLPRAYFEKAGILKSVGRDVEALASYRAIVTKYPESEYAKSAFYEAALLYWKLGDYKSARENFGAFVARYPDDPEAEKARLQIVQIDLDDKDFEAARGALAAFIAERPKSQYLDVAYYKLGVALTALHRYQEALAAFQEVIRREPASRLQPEALYGAGACFESMEDIPGAIFFHERLLREHPEHALAKEVLPRMGYLYIRTKNFDKVKAYYEDVLLNRPEVKIETDGVFWLLQTLLEKKDYDAADRLIEAMPKRFEGQDLSHEVCFFRAESLSGRQDFPKAAEAYAKAIELDRDGLFVPAAYLGAGLSYAAMSDDANAEKNFLETLKYDGEYKLTMRARFELAELKLKARRLEDAAKAFMMVAILYDDPKYTPAALFKAGECFNSLSKLDEAERAFSELKARYPKSEWALKAAPALDRLAGGPAKTGQEAA